MTTTVTVSPTPAFLAGPGLYNIDGFICRADDPQPTVALSSGHVAISGVLHPISAATIATNTPQVATLPRFNSGDIVQVNYPASPDHGAIFTVKNRYGSNYYLCDDGARTMSFAESELVLVTASNNAVGQAMSVSRKFTDGDCVLIQDQSSAWLGFFGTITGWDGVSFYDIDVGGHTVSIHERFISAAPSTFSSQYTFSAPSVGTAWTINGATYTIPATTRTYTLGQVDLPTESPPPAHDCSFCGNPATSGMVHKHGWHTCSAANCDEAAQAQTERMYAGLVDCEETRRHALQWVETKNTVKRY